MSWWPWIAVILKNLAASLAFEDAGDSFLESNWPQRGVASQNKPALNVAVERLTIRPLIQEGPLEVGLEVVCLGLCFLGISQFLQENAVIMS
jgi:hypothetical protein